MKKWHRVLVIYKKSKYQLYFLEHDGNLVGLERMGEEEKALLYESHLVHTRCLAHVEKVLQQYHIPYLTLYRAGIHDIRDVDFVISVGGDGTLIEAARYLYDKPLLGVNSDPQRSVGYFCAANESNFDIIFEQLLKGTLPIIRLARLQLSLDNRILPELVMNELLVAHERPSAMSRYEICIGKHRETHWGSGLWVSTAAGSSGAIYSAGGKLQPARSRQIQYFARELFPFNHTPYQLQKGLVPPSGTIYIRSLMREGQIWLDGSHCHYPFSYGSDLTIRLADYPLQLYVTGEERLFSRKGSR